MQCAAVSAVFWLIKVPPHKKFDDSIKGLPSRLTFTFTVCLISNANGHLSNKNFTNSFFFFHGKFN